MARRIVRIGGASGFWGDSCLAVPQLIRPGNLQYLVFDYLSELTMGILARAKLKNAGHGYALEFAEAIEAELPALTAKGIRIVSNAGGVNPIACAGALRDAASKRGLPVKIAIVTGDDVMCHLDKDVPEVGCGRPIPAKFLSANVSLGALPIKQALDNGANIVVTGRCTGSALTLGALMHEFQWREDDYNKLASGSLAGRIAGCGAQATGGTHTDWRLVPGLADIGYPIVEVGEDGSFVVTKPEGTGGLVTPEVISEQMLYKVGDPGRFVLPDVTCDFTLVQVRQVGENRVAVNGVRGYPPTDSYRACATYADGYIASINLTFTGFDAEEKARRISEALLARTGYIMRSCGFGPYAATQIEVLGAGSRGNPLPECLKAREILSRVTVTHPEQRALRIFARGASWASGAAGLSGRPPISPVIRAFSFLMEKSKTAPVVEFNGTVKAVSIYPGSAHCARGLPARHPADSIEDGDLIEVPLVSLAYGRSGDKYDVTNIAVIARHKEFLPYIREQVTAARARDYLPHLRLGDVVRYDVPGIMAFNFVCEPTRGGEDAASFGAGLATEIYAPLLLSMPVSVPRRLIAERA
jgi:hypothetical protein